MPSSARPDGDDPSAEDRPADADADADGPQGSPRRVPLVVAGVVVLVMVGVLAWGLLRDAGPSTTRSTTSTPSSDGTGPGQPPSGGSSGPEQTPTVTPSLSDEEAATAMWPDPGSSRRFDDPVAAARAFGVEVLGFTGPEPAAPEHDEERSAEVELRSTPGAPATTVALRKLGDETWWVLGASAAELELRPVTAVARSGQDADGDSSTVTSVRIEGRAVAFEGTVEVVVLRDGEAAPAATGVLTAGASGEFSHFRGEIEVAGELKGHGAVVIRTTDAATGQVWLASAARVAFG